MLFFLFYVFFNYFVYNFVYLIECCFIYVMFFSTILYTILIADNILCIKLNAVLSMLFFFNYSLYNFVC